MQRKNYRSQVVIWRPIDTAEKQIIRWNTHTHILEYTGKDKNTKRWGKRRKKKEMKMEDEEQRWRVADLDEDARRNGVKW